MRLRDDQMICPDCGAVAESDSVDVGVGLLVRGNFYCAACEWDIDSDGKANVETYDDWFVDV